jgi:hypothetical protein
VSLSRLVTCLTFLAVFAMAARVSVDSDTWWHLRAGAWIVEHGEVLKTDLFSYTRYGAPWAYPGWLVEAPMYLIYSAFGAGGLNLWTALMVTLAFAFVWGTQSGGVFLKGFVTILAAAASAVYWAARPYLITFLLAAVFLWILEGYRWRRPGAAGRLWWLPLLMVIWANSHGGFAVGFLIWGVYWAAQVFGWIVDGTLLSRLRTIVRHPGAALGDPDLRLWWVGLLMLLAVCLNPSGPVMLLYPFKTVSIGSLQDYIQEWQSPDFHSRQAQPFIWLLLLTLGAVGASRRRLALSDFLLVGGFAYMGLLAWRNIALFALAAPAVLTRHAAPLLEILGRRVGYRGVAQRKERGARRVLNWVLLIVIIFAALVKAGTGASQAASTAVFQETMPVGAVEWIKQTSPVGRLFNTYNWGGYLLWELPEYPVFIDGRTDLYDDEIIDEWLEVMRAGPGWREILTGYDIDLVLVEAGSTLDRTLEQEPGWSEAYRDELAVVYQR